MGDQFNNIGKCYLGIGLIRKCRFIISIAEKIAILAIVIIVFVHYKGTLESIAIFQNG